VFTVYYTVDNMFWPLKLPIMGSLTYQKHVEGFIIMVKYTLEQAMKAQRGSRDISLTSALDGGEWSTPQPSCFTPAKETHYPLYVDVYD
jgi:hypothetical protein